MENTYLGKLMFGTKVSIRVGEKKDRMLNIINVNN
ncbi:hypothetical protein GGR98_003443 [Parageobacillus caldoxylosilyticus]|nr:hypothetical protein [Parageobacillus caldoxylosilyticus]